MDFRRMLDRTARVAALVFESLMFGAILCLAACVALGIVASRILLSVFWQPNLATSLEEMFAIALGPFSHDVARRVLRDTRAAGKPSVSDAREQELRDLQSPETIPLTTGDAVGSVALH